MVGRKQYTRTEKRMRASRTQKTILGLVLLIGVTAVLAYGYQRHQNPKNRIPAQIKSQISFIVFYPGPSTDTSIDTRSFKYDQPTHVFSFVVNFMHQPITFAEQATPQNFIDIPQAYDKLLESLSEYASFNSYYDKVSLAHPKEFKGQQSAVMNSKGTLVFAHPTSGSLNEDQWRKLFNGLEIIR